MNAPLPRLTQRLLIPALMLGAIAWFGEPLPEQTLPVAIAAEARESDELSIALKHEAAALRREAEIVAARRMRLFLTLPGVGSQHRAHAPNNAG